jgi:hypothetical protein
MLTMLNIKKLSFQCIELQGKRVRTFFLCAFSNILKTCSIWLSGSTKPQKDLKKRLSDPVSFGSKGTTSSNQSGSNASASEAKAARRAIN